MLIGVTGYARSGKDTIGAILVKNGFEQHGFADALKDMTLALLQILNTDRYLLVKSKGWDWAKTQTEWGRVYLQQVGSLMRGRNPAFWVDTLMKDYKGNWVITDLRYMNEAFRIHAEGGIIIRVNRPGVGPANSHSSETELDKIVPDFIVENDGSLKDLEKKIENILKNIL